MPGRKRARPRPRDGRSADPSPPKDGSSGSGWPWWEEANGGRDSSGGVSACEGPGGGAGEASGPAPLARLLHVMARHDDRIRLRNRMQAESKAKSASEAAPPKSARRKEKDKAYWDRVKQREEQVRRWRALRLVGGASRCWGGRCTSAELRVTSAPRHARRGACSRPRRACPASSSHGAAARRAPHARSCTRIAARGPRLRLPRAQALDAGQPLPLWWEGRSGPAPRRTDPLGRGKAEGAPQGQAPPRRSRAGAGRTWGDAPRRWCCGAPSPSLPLVAPSSGLGHAAPGERLVPVHPRHGPEVQRAQRRNRGNDEKPGGRGAKQRQAGSPEGGGHSVGRVRALCDRAAPERKGAEAHADL